MASSPAPPPFAAYETFAAELVALNRPLLGVVGLDAGADAALDANGTNSAAAYFVAARQKLLGLLAGRPPPDEDGPRRERMAVVPLARDTPLTWREAARTTPAMGTLGRGTPNGGVSPSPPAQPISPLSPRNPASPLYPDGLVTPRWLARYRAATPCAVAYFAEVREDPRDGSSADVSRTPTPVAVRVQVAEADDPLAEKDSPVGPPPPPTFAPPPPATAPGKAPLAPTPAETSADTLLIAQLNAYKARLPPGARLYPVLLSRLDHVYQGHPRAERIRRETSSERVFVLAALPGIPGTGAAPLANDPVDAAAFVAGIHSHVLSSAVPREFYAETKARNVRKKRAKLRAPPPGGVDDAAGAGGQPGSGPAQGTLARIVRLEFKHASFLSFAAYAASPDSPLRLESLRSYEACLGFCYDLIANSLGIAAPRAAAAGNAYHPPEGPRWLELVRLADALCHVLVRSYLAMAAHGPPTALQEHLGKALSVYRTHVAAMCPLPEFNWDLPAPTDAPFLPAGLAAPRGGGTPLFWAWLSKFSSRLFSPSLAALPSLARAPEARFLPGPSAGPMGAREALGIVGENLARSMLPGQGGWGWWDAHAAGIAGVRARRAAEGRRWAEAASEAPAPAPAAAPRSLVTVTRAPAASAPQPDPAAPLGPPTGELAAGAVDLLTRAYEHYKAAGRPRWTVHLAGRIAGVYAGWDGLLDGTGEGRNDAMAARFWERVGRAYRPGWTGVLADVAGRRVASCRGWLAGMAEGAAEAKKAWQGIAEGLVEGVAVGEFRAAEAAEELRRFCAGTGVGEIVVDMEALVQFATPTFAFVAHAAHLPQPIAFQLAFGVSSVVSHPLTFDRLLIRFSDSRYDLEIEHSDSAPGEVRGTASLAQLDAARGADGVWRARAPLMLAPGGLAVFQGRLVPEDVGDLRAVGADLVWARGGANRIRLSFRFPDSRTLVSPDRDRRPHTEPASAPAIGAFKRKWLCMDPGSAKARVAVLESAGEPPLVRITRRQPTISVSLDHPQPAFVGESFPVKVVVANGEQEPVHLFLAAHVGREHGPAPEGIPTIPHHAHGKHRHDDSDGYFVSSAGGEFDPTEIVGAAAAVGAGEMVQSPTGSVGSYLVLPQHTSRTGYLDLGVLGPGESIERTLYVRCDRGPGERAVHATIYSRISDENDGRLALERSGSVGSVTANAVAELTNQDMYFRRTETATVRVEEPFGMRMAVRPADSRGGLFCGIPGAEPDSGDGPGRMGWEGRMRFQVSCLVLVGLKFVGPGDIEVDSADLVSDGWPNSSVAAEDRTFEIEVDAKLPQGTTPKVWGAGIPFNFGYLVRTFHDPVTPSEPIPTIGHFDVRWRRVTADGATSAPWATARVDLPGILNDPEPVKVLTELPSGIPKQSVPFRVCYLLHNTSLVPQRIAASMSASDSFVFSGTKSASILLLPLAVRRLEYAVYPLRAGHVRLPRLKLVVGGPERAAEPQAAPGRPSTGPPDEKRATPVPSPDPAGRTSMSASPSARNSIGDGAKEAGPVGRELRVPGQTADEGCAVFVMPNIVMEEEVRGELIAEP
ncbi:hypothetical protein DFJ74DRAFT_2180 [Hyaloraphidium curvatum]|nr:hypothetical protein DFJ74DRAFT_2180 [Hyaloraphidium curvatum]